MKKAAKQVIIITDGDKVARRAVEKAAENVGGRCISLSAGNPTSADGMEIADAVKHARGNPVLVMVDDGGARGFGIGERAVTVLAGESGIEIIGAIAVASHTGRVSGAEVQASVDRRGEVVGTAVDKDGNPKHSSRVAGDTVDVLNNLHIPIIGIGDLGKMDKADDVEGGAAITTKAVREVLERAGREADA